MAASLLKDNFTSCPAQGVLLGLDVGSKTIGLAISNDAQTMAVPLKTLKRQKFTKDFEAIQAICAAHEVCGFVIGYPVNMNDTRGPRAQSVYDFAQEVAQRSNLYIGLWDERLSTVSAENIVDEFVGKKKTRRKAKEAGLIDQLAAQLILQNALDYLALARKP